MADENSEHGPLAFKQWDDKPTWMLDRGRDDHGMHPSDDHVRTGFHAALVDHRDKTAQMTDAAVAFICFKKTAGLMGAAKSLGGMAMRNPHAADAAVGAAGGALAGGPNHRLSGAAIGGAVGLGAGHAVSRMAPAAAKPMMSGAASKAVGLAGQSPEALAAARAEMAAGGGKAIRGVGESPGSSVPNPSAGANPNNQNMTQAMPTYRPTPSVAASAQHYDAAVARGQLSGPRPSHFPPPENPIAKGTAPSQGIPTAVGKMKQAWIPPFVVADDSKIAPLGGESSAKVAAVIGELAQAADHGPGRFHIPGLGAVVGAVDDLAQVGRQKLQAMISRRNNQQQQKPQPAPVPKLAMAFPVKRAIQSAAGWGAAGAVTGALTAKPGNRTRGAIVGGLAGGAGGAVAPMAEHQVGKLLKMAAGVDGSPLMDMRQRAAERFPEKVSPIEAIRTDFKSALHLIQDKLHDLGSLRGEFAHPKVAAVGLDLKELAHLGGMPKQLMSRTGLATAAVGSAVGGGLAYLSSRGKKEHGGKSQAEVDYAQARAKQPENPQGIRQTIGKHVIGLHHDVAEQMRKHPIAATAMGAGAGAGLALKLAPILGVASHLK